MQEYWVNVYKYPKLSNYCYSHNIPTLKEALKYAAKEWSKKFNSERKCVYRIHVKMKPVIKITVIDNCGKEHTYQEWQKCGACKVAKTMNGIFGRDNWME